MHYVCRTSFNAEEARKLRESPLVGLPVRWRHFSGVGARTITIPAKVVAVLAGGRIRISAVINGKDAVRTVDPENLIGLGE